MSAPAHTRAVLAADWLGACRRAAEGVRSVMAAHPETADRARTTGRGEGGDMALVIDRRAEDAIFEQVEGLGVPVCAVSEERGHVDLHGGGPVHVIIDPIDGSLNAKRGLPLYSLSIAVASGSTMGDVELAYVYDLGRDEEWWAQRGEGAFAGGRKLPALGGEREFEIVGLESANPRVVAACAEQLAAAGARRLRAIGSIALSLAFVAGSRFDAMLSLYGCRSVDAAAGQLLVRELGGAVLFPDAGGAPENVSVDLDMRSRVVAAANEDILGGLLEAMPDDPPRRRAS